MALVGILLKDFVSNLSILDTFGSLRYKWNKSKCQLELKSSTRINICNFRIYAAVFNMSVALYQMVTTLNVGSRMVITHSAMMAADYLLGLVSHCVHARETKEFINLFNSFIDFEMRWYTKPKCAKNSTNKEKSEALFTKYLMQMMAATAIFVPLFAHLEILRNPCWPSYAGYWISGRCQAELGSTLSITWTLKEFAATIGITLFAFFTWTFLICCYCFQVSVSLILQGYCMRVFIAKFGSTMKKIRTVTSETRKNVMAYRELQIFAIQYRFINSRYFLGLHSFAIIVAAVMCMYNTIIWIQNPGASSVQLGLNALFLWCAVVTIFIFIFVYGILAGVYKISKNVNEAMNCNERLKTNKWFTRFLKTCPPIRIFIGGNNFLDELMPLTLEDFVINQTVSLLLLD
ncbi:unnamed protein product [Orchesella dallaii]|uniref:Odorant receptor n=1 Tax=Orchesella dallaii TaxID=48710 RepID=A0ABP1RH87_9HEXA